MSSKKVVSPVADDSSSSTSNVSQVNMENTNNPLTVVSDIPDPLECATAKCTLIGNESFSVDPMNHVVDVTMIPGSALKNVPKKCEEEIGHITETAQSSLFSDLNVGHNQTFAAMSRYDCKSGCHTWTDSTCSRHPELASSSIKETIDGSDARSKITLKLPDNVGRVLQYDLKKTDASYLAKVLSKSSGWTSMYCTDKLNPLSLLPSTSKACDNMFESVDRLSSNQDTLFLPHVDLKSKQNVTIDQDDVSGTTYSPCERTKFQEFYFKDYFEEIQPPYLSSIKYRSCIAPSDPEMWSKLGDFFKNKTISELPVFSQDKMCETIAKPAQKLPIPVNLLDKSVPHEVTHQIASRCKGNSFHVVKRLYILNKAMVDWLKKLKSSKSTNLTCAFPSYIEEMLAILDQEMLDQGDPLVFNLLKARPALQLILEYFRSMGIEQTYFNSVDNSVTVASSFKSAVDRGPDQQRHLQSPLTIPCKTPQKMLKSLQISDNSPVGTSIMTTSPPKRSKSSYWLCKGLFVFAVLIGLYCYIIKNIFY